MVKIYLLFIFINLIHSEILYEQGELKEFIGGDCSSCLYDNFINHTSEGIASENYNIYAPDWIDIQNNGFGNYKIINAGSSTLDYWEIIFNSFISGNFDNVDQLLEDSLSSYQRVPATVSTYTLPYIGSVVPLSATERKGH